MSGKEKKKGGIKKLFGSRFRAGSYSAFAAAVVILIAILVNLTVSALPTSVTELDLTKNSLFTLSDQTKRIVTSLEKDVHLYLLASSGSEDDTILRLLNRYAELSDHVFVEAVDPNAQPTFLNAYELTAKRLYSNSVIVDSDGRYRLVSYNDIYVTDYSMDYYTYSYTTTTSFDGENVLTNAIHYVTSESLPKVYTLTGHGEAELSDSMTESIASDNMETESLSLLTLESIPEDAAVIIIHAPSTDINEEEANLLIDWLQKGGCVALTTGYFNTADMPNLLKVTAAMGLTAADGIIVEGDSNMHYPRYPHYLLPSIESHTITDALIDGRYYTFLPIAQGIVETGSSEAAVTWLLSTSDSAYAKVAGYSMTTTEKEEGDTDGPFYVGAIAEQGEGKLLWIACGDFLESSVDQVVSGGNSNLYLNALSYMTEREESISIRSKSMDAETLTVPAAASNLWSILLIGVVPLTLSAVGIIIRIRRKRR